MVYEIALLPIHEQHLERFRQAFAEVVPLLCRAQGYGSHLLAQGIENPLHFNLIVRWQSLEDHTQRFEVSDDHQLFMQALEPYFSAEPTLYHIEGAAFAGATSGEQGGPFGSEWPVA